MKITQNFMSNFLLCTELMYWSYIVLKTEQLFWDCTVKYSPLTAWNLIKPKLNHEYFHLHESVRGSAVSSSEKIGVYGLLLME